MSNGGHVMSVREMIETLDVVTNHYDAVHRHNSWTDIARESIICWHYPYFCVYLLSTRHCMTSTHDESSKSFLSILAYQKLSNTGDSKALVGNEINYIHNSKVNY